MEMHTYYVCLLRKGPVWTAEETPELEQLQARHLTYGAQLMESSATLASGPVDDGSDIRGFRIFRTATLAEAQALAEADPSVLAGRLVVELHPWMVPTGILPEPPAEPH
jgi:uncharacterized protein YciI